MSASADILPLFADRDRRHRRVQELSARIAALESADALASRLDAFEALVTWVKTRDGACPFPSGDDTPVAPEIRRLSVFAALLDRSAALATVLRVALVSVFAETEGLPLFAEAGLPNDRGIMDETADRLARRLLPRPRDDFDLSRFVSRLFPKPRDADWLSDLPPDLFARICERLAGERGAFAAVLDSIGEAMCLLAARVQTLGFGEAIRARRHPVPLRESPYFRLSRSTDALLENLHVPAVALDLEREFRADADACRAGVDEVLAELENTGISIDVVYSLDVITRALDRMDALLGVLKAAPGAEQAASVHRLMLVLVRARLSDRSLRELARENLRLMARKLIERAGRTGEHYITTTRREWLGMIASGAGGGVLTAGTASLKVTISGAHFAPFVEGFVSGVNYSISFILILFFGFTLATKQPSMTGAALAGVLHEKSGPSRATELASLVARIVRSQLAAAMGNVLTVAIVATAFDWFWRWRTGASFMTLEKSEYTLHSLDPLGSGTIFYACVTGVILWLSSLAGGWVENFSVYRRLPLAIAEHRLGRLVGKRAMAAAARFFARNISGYGGSIALGFMLGMTPIMGKFFGLPLDVRHVTLSTGTLALAAGPLGPAALFDHRVHMALVGIAIIFTCNLSVSFLLALGVAIRARDVSAHDRWQLLGAIGRQFLRSPGSFFFPPAKDTTAPAPHH